MKNKNKLENLRKVAKIVNRKEDNKNYSSWLLAHYFFNVDSDDIIGDSMEVLISCLLGEK